MSQYTITLQLPTKEQFLGFIDTVGPLVGVMSISVTPDDQAPAEAEYNAPPMRTEPKKPRQLRGSKVNAAILEALERSTLTVKQLKEALERAGMSPGSLSTGIAALTKEGEIERVSEGVYALVGMQQAA